MAKYKYRFSIFTATYNRSGNLKKLYNDILKQDFDGLYEWIIVSDGSTDDTEDVVNTFESNSHLTIRFVSQAHGGKHKAWRTATNLFEGRYVLTADDDDPIPPTALSVFDKYWKELEKDPDYNQFWEVKSRAQYENGTLVGPELPIPYYDSNYIDITFKQKKGAEMDGCRKVEVLRNEAAVPDFFYYDEKCTNYPEGVRWTAAARKYKTRFVPDITRTYVIGHESLCTSTSKSRSSQRNYNSLVSSLYTIKGNGDLLLRYMPFKYFKLQLQLAYSAIRVNEHVYSLLDRIVDKMAYCMVHIPAYLLYQIRNY